MRNQKTLGPGTTLGPLIEELGPLNNQWRFGTAREKVLILWDIGDALLRTIKDPGDELLWHVQEKSYITRNILRYALIVRRGWAARDTLEQLTRGLQSFTLFREALPFLKGDREHIDDKTYGQVEKALYDPNCQRAITFVQGLKRQHIGREHHKGSTIAGIKADAAKFLAGIADVETQLHNGWIVLGPPETLVRLSQVAMAIASGDFITAVPTAEVATEALRSVRDGLVAATRSRAANGAFRKAVGAERLMQAADLLNALRTRESYNDWCDRRGLQVTVEKDNSNA